MNKMHGVSGSDERGVSRRAFVAGMAGAAAGLALGTPAVASRQPGEVSPNSRLNVGVIGTGTRGKNLMNGRVLPSGRMRLVAVCDVDRTRREHWARVGDERYGEVGAVTAYAVDDELLAREDIDAVVIATPDHWHATQCLKALRAGKHVYCDKPLTHTLHEGKVLSEAAARAKRERGLVFLTGSQQRTEYRHDFVRAVDYVRNGAIGTVLTVNVGVGDPSRPCDLPTEATPEGLDWDRWLGPAPVRGYNKILCPEGIDPKYPAFREYDEYANGRLADWWAHHGDIAQWAMGMDRSGPVEALPPEDGEMVRGVELRYANGVRLTHGGAWGVTFSGTEGLLFAARPGIRSIPDKILETELGGDAVLQPRHANHTEHFLDCIEGKAEAICDAEVGARSAAAAQVVNLCYRLRRPLKWDPVAWRFVGDEGANGLLDYERREGYGLGG